MGTVRRLRKKYSGPSHPWEAERLGEEKKLVKSYGLKNKKEVWKITSKLRSFKSQAKKLIARTDEQARKEEKLLIKKLISFGIIKEGSTLDSILEIDIEKLLERRLQTIIMTKGLARTARQARQMITHGHIAVNNQKVNVPSYLVNMVEETKLSFSKNSNFNDKEHPELVVKKKDEKEKVDVKEIKPKTEMKKPEEKTVEKAPKEVAQPKTPKPEPQVPIEKPVEVAK